MYTAKHAMLCREKYPDTEVYVFYIDVRTPGKNFDEFYRRAVEEYGVHYIKGMVGKVAPDDGKLKVQASDLLGGEQLHIDADMVVLAAAIEPDKSPAPWPPCSPPPWTPTTSSPRPIPSCARWRAPPPASSSPAPARAPRISPRPWPRPAPRPARSSACCARTSCSGNPCVAEPDELMCNGCSSCEKVCPYGAITYIDKEFRGPNRTTLIRRVAQVNPAVCQGCGACTVACPSGAMDLKGFSTVRSWRRWMPYASKRRIQAHHCGVLLQLVLLRRRGPVRHQPA